MIVGVPREIKNNEYRVALVPSGAEALVEAGHTVLVEAGAGQGTAIEDSEYQEAGAQIVATDTELFARADMVMKVKEPQSQEYPLLRPGQIIFTYFHFAASEELTRAMVASKAVCVAYETIQLPDGTLPLLTPMSEVAGRMAIQEGAKYLERPMEGRGILLAGVPGVHARHRGHSGRRGRGRECRQDRRGLRSQRLSARHQPGAPALPRRRDAAQRHHHLLEPPEHRASCCRTPIW